MTGEDLKNVELSQEFKWDMSGNGSIFEHESNKKGTIHIENPHELKDFYNSVNSSLKLAFNSVASLADDSELPIWRDFFKDVKTLDEAWEVAEVANAVAYEDWQSRTTEIDEYTQNSKPYAFICHSVTGDEPYKAEEYKRAFISCSLLTDCNHNTIGQGYGFVYSPSKIVAAYGQDAGTNFIADKVEHLFKYRIPVIQTFDQVIEQTPPDSYNEVVIFKTNPIGIFNVDDGTNKNYNEALKLQKLNQDLRIITLH